MRILPALLAAAAIGTSAIQEPASAAKLSTEIDRARARLQAAAPEPERAAPLARLDRARAALAAGRLYLAAYLLESPWEGSQNFTFIKASAGVTSQEAFLEKWRSMGAPRLVVARKDRVPAVVDAIASVAEARGATTYQASRMYAADSGLFGGLYYLADSHSVMQFASLVRGFEWAATPPRPAFRSIAREIAAFDIEMTTAYETMEKASHPTYISASAALKQARTLNDRGQHTGAMFEYLLSRYLFAPLRGPASAEATSARVTEARGGLASAADHTIAEMFLQLADEGLAGGSDTQRRNAAAILEDVLPAYRAAIAPGATNTRAAKAQVTITLVRWPFT